ncbi:hypothetical protein ACJMK2_028104 [Sinanodonta woodiana]|uniref:Uncharacterized protein n=1 Tax=Sinanodonta woodiana TaxID=1069815 RepID=A0ABD3X623_SINWO
MYFVSIFQHNHLTTTPKSPDDGSLNIGAIVAGVLVPLIVIGIGLLVFYIWYRKKYPVRMVFGKDFGKFTNPLYDKRHSTLSLVRDDAHKFWEGNEAGLDGPASETDADEKEKVFMEVSGQNPFKSASGKSLVVEDWRVVESDGSSGINTVDISQSSIHRKLINDVNDESPLVQSDTGKGKAKKMIHVDTSVFESVKKQDSTESEEDEKDDIVPEDSTENNIVFQLSVEVEQNFAETFEKATDQIHFEETVSLGSTFNKIRSEQSTYIAESVDETSENKVINLKHLDEKPLEPDKEENDVVEEKETHNSDQLVGFGTHINDESVMVVNIPNVTNEPTGSMEMPNKPTNMEVEKQTDLYINLPGETTDDEEALESTLTDREHIFRKVSHPVEQQLDVSCAESSAHLSGHQWLQDKQVMIQIPESEQQPDHDEEQLQKQLYTKDLTCASVEDVHQLSTPKDELALADLSTENEEDIEHTAEVTKQKFTTLIPPSVEKEMIYVNVDNEEALRKHTIQNEAESENIFKNNNIVHETQQCSVIYGQLNPNIQTGAEFSSGECAFENIYSHKAEFTPHDTNTDQEEKARAHSNAYSTSESGSTDSSFDDDGASSETMYTPSLDGTLHINSSKVPNEESLPSLSFEKLETVKITPDVSRDKFAEEQFQEVDSSVVLEMDVTDILDKDVERIPLNQSVAKGFNVKSSDHVTIGHDFDIANSSNLNKQSAKSYKPVNGDDQNSSERSLSTNLKKIQASFKNFDSSSSDSDDESSDDSDEKLVDDAHVKLPGKSSEDEYSVVTFDNDDSELDV